MCNECERSSMVHLTSLCCHLNQKPFFYSRTHSMIKHVTSSSDWWMLFGHSNNPRGSTLNNDQRTWLMSTVSSCWGESFRLSLLPRAPCDERSSFARWLISVGPNFLRGASTLHDHSPLVLVRWMALPCLETEGWFSLTLTCKHLAGRKLNHKRQKTVWWWLLEKVGIIFHVCITSRAVDILIAVKTLHWDKRLISNHWVNHRH